MNAFLKSTRNFLRDEEGAQIIEYALIVAVVSIGLMLLIQLGLLGANGSFQDWLDTVQTCLNTGTCTRA